MHYTILLQSPADVKELQPPSWRTATHLFILVAILCVLMFTFFTLGSLSDFALESKLNPKPQSGRQKFAENLIAKHAKY